MKTSHFKGAFLAALALALPVASFATPAGDYDAITGAVDFAQVAAGIGAIAALVAVVLVVKRGSGWLLRMIGR